MPKYPNRLTDCMTSKRVSVLLLLSALCLLRDATSAYRILLMPLAGRSHVMSQVYIGQALARRGHDAYILLPEGLKLPAELSSNGSLVHVERYGKSMLEVLGTLDYDAMSENTTQLMLSSGLSAAESLKFMTPVAEAERRRLVENNDDLLARLRSLKLDMAVVDHLVFMDYGYLIPHALGVPWITYSDHIQSWIVRVPDLPSFVPHKFLTFTEKMTFKERVINTVVNVFASAYLGMSKLPEHLEAKYKRYGDFTSMNDLQSRSVLFITSSDIALDYATPTMPNLIAVGGLSVKPADGKALPRDIESFMSRSKNGVILVSFGSMVSTLPTKMADKFVEAFRRLSEYGVIWRFENKDELTMPDNVMVLKWLLQNDILADQRVKLFITHCGNNGQFEALYHAVPMIGFPLFGDQPFNAKRIEYKGYGRGMDLHAFTADELVNNARKIIDDKSFKARITRASDIFKSSPDTPGERAAYWIEHVIKYGGAHLRSAGSDLDLYQYYVLDVLLVVGVVVVTSLACFCKLVQLTWRRCRRVLRKSKSSKTSSNKKKSE